MKKLFTLLTTGAIFAACGATAKAVASVETIGNFESIISIEKQSHLNNVKYITDGSSVDDKSFNKVIWKGVKEYTGSGDQYYVIPSDLSIQALQTLYARTSKDTQMMVVAGYQHRKPLAEFQANLETGRGIIYLDGEVKGPAINSIIFNAEEAAFMAGYLTSQYLSVNADEYNVPGSEGLKVGTFGGMNIQPVVAFMGGFQQGVAFWNANVKDGDKTIEFIKLGDSLDSYFSGNFDAGSGRSISERLVNQGADVILPVSGRQVLDTLEVISEKEAKTLIIGVDIDQATAFAQHSDKFLTSIQKNLDLAANNAIKAAFGEEPAGEYGLGKTTVGTIANGLLSLSFEGTNKLSELDYQKAIEDEKISSAALGATKELKA